MNNPLVVEIANLHEMLEEKENEHQTLINSGADENTLQKSHGAIEMLKQRLQALEDMLLDDAFEND
ncbi:MAG TPA: hypothetical protein VHB70_02510 [Parafilimonas sp.]|nr:hypothetical protein [Parafilimonas sp.]